MNLSAAMSRARPGDLFWLREGTYTGEFTFTRDGTSSNPIVWRAYTDDGVPERATIRGYIRTTGKWNWFWGLEITDPTEAVDRPGVEFFDEGSRIINCVVQHVANHNGVGAWNTGRGQVIYGTVLLRNGFSYGSGQGRAAPHNIYTQNDFDRNGYKYFIQIMSLDASDVPRAFSFHAYGTNGKVSGLWVQDSIFDRGRFLIGRGKATSSNNVVRSNYFHDMTASDSSISLGWKGPSEVEFADNYIVKGTVNARRHWGAGGDTGEQDQPNRFIGNELYEPLHGYHIRLTTATISNGSIREGSPAIRKADVWEDNTYGGSFRASLKADGSYERSIDGLGSWRNLTQNARESSTSGFDVDSSVVSNPTRNKVVLLRNEYESGRGHLAIYNWENSGRVSVDLSDVVRVGKTYQVRDARKFYGTPVVAGTYRGGSVSVPTAGQFMAVFVVTSDP